MKKLVKILVLIICLIVFVILSYLIIKDYKNKAEDSVRERQEYISINKNDILGMDIYSGEGEGELNNNQRKEFINYSEENINELTPFLSNYESKWLIDRFAFVNNNNFYIEYHDNHALGRVLVYCVKAEEKINCSRIAYFEPINYSWKLNEGNDSFSERTMQYYEKNKENLWESIYSSKEIFYFPVSYDTLLGIQQLADGNKDIWRLDPNEVTKRNIADVFSYSLEDIECRDKTNEEDTIIEVKYNESIYEVYLSQPIKTGKYGIWAIKYLKFVK